MKEQFHCNIYNNYLFSKIERLRTNCLEEGEPTSDFIELISLLNTRPKGYQYKFQSTAVAIKDTFIRFRHIDEQQGYDIGIDYIFDIGI